MEFFSSNFDARKVLNDLSITSSDCKSFASVDEFEKHLCDTDAALVAMLQQLEVPKEVKRLPTTKEREIRLAEMCARRGRTVTEPVNKPTTSDLTKELNGGNFFKTDQRGPMKRLKDCVDGGDQVCIMLRARNSVNSFIQARIVAFDKHWNLLIRDGDESFLPSTKMKRQATKNMQRPYRYSQIQCEDWKGTTKTIWQRHLPFSLIRGDDVVLIFTSSRSIKSFLRGDQPEIHEKHTHEPDSRKPFRLLQGRTDKRNVT